MVKVKCLIPVFNDLEAKTTRKIGEIFEVTGERAKYLAGAKTNNIVAVEILEEIKEEKEEESKKEEEIVVEKPVKKAKNVSRETKKKK